MAKDPVMGPVSPMEDPRQPKLIEILPEEALPEPAQPSEEPVAEETLAEEVQEGDKEVHEEMTALEADSVTELVAGLDKLEKEGEDVQLEAEAVQTYEYELRTELAMRPLEDVMFMAQVRGIGPVTGLSKEEIARMILRHEGFATPEPAEPAPEEPNLPRYSARVKRAIESRQQ